MSLPGTMDHELCQQMTEHIEQLVMSGQMTLDVEIMKKVKKICRQSDSYVTHAFHQLMVLLEKEHSEIRLSAFQIVNELFNRSHCFRELLLSDFQNFMDLTIETDLEEPLPPPKPVAKILKSKCTEAIQQWQEKFGDTYKKLTLGYNFLKDCKKVDFADIRARTVAERRLSAQNRQRQEMLQQQRVNTALQQMTDMSLEIKDCMTQAENCLLLLLPHPETFQLHGLKSPDPRFTGNDVPHPLAQATAVSSSKDVDNSVASSSESKLKSALPEVSCDLMKDESKGSERQSNAKMSTHVTQESDSEGLANDGRVSDKLESVAQNTGACSSVDTSSESSVKVKSEPSDAKSESKQSCPQFDDAAGDEEGDSSDDFEEISDETGDESEEDRSDLVRDHGLGSQNYSLSIDLPPDGVHLKETADNTDILHALKDIVQLIQNKFLPSLQKWLEIFSKAGNQEHNIRKAIDLKQLALKVKFRICRLKVSRMKKDSGDKPGGANAAADDDDDDDDDEDFEEVPQKEGFEPRIPDHLREEYGLVKKPPKPSTSRDWTMPAPSRVQEHQAREAKEEEQDPASWSAAVKRLEQEMKEEQRKQESQEGSAANTSIAGPSGSVQVETKQGPRKDGKLLEKAPVMPYGTDLFHWGEDMETPLLVRYDSEHRFWTPKDDTPAVDVNALESMKSRLIEFVGEFKPVKWKCRAPLPSGALCERMDRVKCPFHGKIIARNVLGQPANTEDLHELERQQERKQQEGVPEWEDPQLQADIKAATGIDLARKGKGKGRGKGKGKQKKYPNLTDIKKVTNTSRKRLEAKVLSRKALKRVASAMDALEHKKFKDKFGNTFLNTFSSK